MNLAISPIAPSISPRARRRARPITPYILAAIVGGIGTAMQLAIQTTGNFAYAFPIVSAGLLGLALTRVAPWWLATALVAALVTVGVVRVQGVARRHRADGAAIRTDLAMGDVCDGTPLGRAPRGAKLRVMERSDGDKVWLDHNAWPAGKIPTYVMCIAHATVQLACDRYTDPGHPERGPERLCTTRDRATAELRVAETAEVVFTRTYDGAVPPPLPSYVQFGGGSSTQLHGGDVSYEAIYPDIAAILSAPR